MVSDIMKSRVSKQYSQFKLYKNSDDKDGSDFDWGAKIS